MKMNKSRYIQLIHVGKGQLGWDDELYRSNLVALTKKNSCLDMSVIELNKVLEFMKSKGFKPVSNKAKGKYSPKTRDKSSHTPLDKLRQLWIAMKSRGYVRDGSDNALLNWTKSQAKRLNHNVAIERLEWLKPGMTHALIEQLKLWYKRELISDLADVLPALHELPLNNEERFKARSMPSIGQLHSCNVEWLESSIAFIGLMLGKYGEQGNGN